MVVNSQAVPWGRISGDASTATIDCFMVSCPEREAVRHETLESLRESDWPMVPELIVDNGSGPPCRDRMCNNFLRAITAASSSSADFVLMLEDDLIVNRFLLHNVVSWPPLARARRSEWFYGSLYHQRIPPGTQRHSERCFVARPKKVWGSLALILTPQTLCLIRDEWDRVSGNPDERMPRIAATKTPLYYHIPSLVDHRREPSTWGAHPARASKFVADWRAA